MMKKIAKILLCLTMSLVVLTSCGSAASGNTQGADAPDSIDGAPTLTVGLIQLMEHTSLDEIRTAFEAQLLQEAQAQGYNVIVDYKNAQNDISMINSICRQFVDDKVDAIVAIATPAAQGAATATSEIPIIFSAVTDPIEAGLIEEGKEDPDQYLQRPNGNITGTSDRIEIAPIFVLADTLTPGIQTYGFIYNKGEANSVSVIRTATKYLTEHNIKIVEKTVTHAGEVQQTARALLEDCDAVFAPIDNTVASAMHVLSDEANKKGKPVYVAADSMVRDGGLATVGINYTQLGKQTADMTFKVLKGTPIAEIPVEVLSNLQVVVNEETAAQLNVDVSAYAQ